MLTPEQLERRRSGVGASDIGAIAGLSHYATAWDIWCAKTLGPTPETDEMALGSLLEPALAALYARRHPDVELAESRTIAHPQHPWALATPDRLVLADGQVQRLLEIKTAGPTTRAEWGTEDDAIPEGYLAQCQWQLFVTGLRTVDVIALVAGEPRFYRVERSDRLIQWLFAHAAAFMERLRNGTPPALDGSEAAGRWLAATYPETRAPLREATTDESTLLAQYAAAREIEKSAAAEKERLAQALKLAIGDREGMQSESLRATLKAPRGVTTRWEAVARELGATDELIAKHSTPVARRLDVRAVKERHSP